MTKFKITVRITDSTTETTIDAIQPIQEILMPELSFGAFQAMPRALLGARHRWCTRADDQSHRPSIVLGLRSGRAQAS
jgi:hypothetical protein